MGIGVIPIKTAIILVNNPTFMGIGTIPIKTAIILINNDPVTLLKHPTTRSIQIATQCLQATCNLT